MNDFGQTPPMRLIEFLHARFSAVADPQRAVQMAAFTRTALPVYGVSAAQQAMIVLSAKTEFGTDDADLTWAQARSLWSRPHREMKYAAIEWAAQPIALRPRALTLHRHMIVDGAWSDLADKVAQRLVGGLLTDFAPAVWPTLAQWAEHSNLWLRRAALVAQVGRGEATDGAWLISQCTALLDDGNFFIQEAIGVALRDHGAVQPELVADFLRSVRGRLSRLPYERAARPLIEGGYLSR